MLTTTTAEHFQRPQNISEIDRLTVHNRGKWNECGTLIAMVTDRTEKSRPRNGHLVNVLDKRIFAT